MARVGAAFVKPISPETLRSFLALVPEPFARAMCVEAELYQVSTAESSATPLEVRAGVAKIGAAVQGLIDCLKQIDPTTSDTLAISNASIGGPETGEVISMLRRYRSIVWTAERALPKAMLGRGPSSTDRDRLARRLAGIIIAAGQVADARPTGPLSLAVKICLDHAGKSVSDTSKMIRRALK